MTIAALERMSDDEVRDTARALGLGSRQARRRDLIYDILEAQATATADARPERRRAARPRRPIAPSWPAYMQDFDPARVTLDGLIRKVGVLELLPDGYGFLRSAEYSYLPSADDIYVSPSQIKRFSLRLGDTVDGQVRPPKEGERFFALLRVHSINGRAPEDFTERTGFDFLTPGYPDAPLRLEPAGAAALTPDAALTARLIDLVAPLGKGQRGLIVTPPGAGRTLLIEHLARALRAGHPEATLIVLLVDERPEDAAAAERALPGVEVIATTFDDPPERQVHVAELVLEKAKRLVEAGQDVVVLVDSLTRLVRAHTAVARASRGRQPDLPRRTPLPSAAPSASSAQPGRSRKAAASPSSRRSSPRPATPPTTPSPTSSPARATSRSACAPTSPRQAFSPPSTCSRARRGASRCCSRRSASRPSARSARAFSGSGRARPLRASPSASAPHRPTTRFWKEPGTRNWGRARARSPA